MPARPKKLNEDILFAARDGDIASVRFLLAGDSALARKSNIANNTPLRFAAESGHTAVCSLLLDYGADIEAKENDLCFLSHGWTPLHYAIWNNHGEVVSLLLKNGAKIDSKTNMGESPLHFGALKGVLEIVRILIANGANREEKDKLLSIFLRSNRISWKNTTRPRKRIQEEERSHFLA
jgi:ankyrin repeat protein